jgi:hypothetical protein
MIAADCCYDGSESIFERNLIGSSLESVKQQCYGAQIALRDTLSACLSEVRVGEVDLLQWRAWVLQEMVLSPRTLRWSRKQLKWHCRSVLRAEDEEHISNSTEEIDSSLAEGWWKVISLSKDSLKTILHSRPSASGSLHLWYGLVDDFSRRKITFKTDAIPAISGISREIRRHTG